MITALVSVYGFTEQVYKNIKKIEKQVDRVIIADNSKNKSFFPFGEKIIYHFNNSNKGISKAFNEILKDNQFNWCDDDYVVFFDQDTEIPENHINILINNFLSIEKKGYKIGCIGPCYYNLSSKKKEKDIKHKKISEHLYMVEQMLTSSLLSRYGILRSIDFWNEALFLDLCDWDLCWRLNNKKYICILSDMTIINHKIGRGEVKIGFLKVKEGEPIREYYQTRDCIKLLNKSYTPFFYKIRFVMQLSIRPLIHVLVLSDKKERLNYIKMGFRDFRLNRCGEIEKL